jgi:hypothetical protein
MYPLFVLSTYIIGSLLLYTIQITSAQCTVCSLAVNRPPMNTASFYAVIGSSKVTNTGNTLLNGNLGLMPGTSVVGFPPGIYSGVRNVANSPALIAKQSAQAAYTNIKTRPPGSVLSALDGLTLVPGTYTSASSMTLGQSTGATLTLDAGGNSQAQWLFQIGSTLTTGAGGASQIIFINGGCPANVYWQVGSSATINVTPLSVFVGSILAQISITIGSGIVQGTMVALTGAVTITSASTIGSMATSKSSGCAPVTRAPGASPAQNPAHISQCIPKATGSKGKMACLIKTSFCASVGAPMEWVNPGCQTDNGIGNNFKWGDGGCQCAGYCGFGCAEACLKSGRCNWTKGGCSKKNGQPELIHSCSIIGGG